MIQHGARRGAAANLHHACYDAPRVFLRAALAAKTLLQSGLHGICSESTGWPGQFSRESMDIGVFYVQRGHFPPFFLNSTMVERGSRIESNGLTRAADGGDTTPYAAVAPSLRFHSCWC